jgi:hypothetical protein
MKIGPSFVLHALLPALALAGVVFLAASSFADSPASTGAAMAGSGSPGAEARYQRERVRCLSGQSQEDAATCLKEAGAALQAARLHQLTSAQADQLAANARKRCDPLPDDQKRACLARMNGEGTVSGSVDGGGLLREYVEIVPGTPAEASAPAAVGSNGGGSATTTTTTTTTGPTPLPPSR